MSLLQLALAHVLATAAFDRKVRQTVASLTTLGATIYTAGYVLGLAWPSCHWLVLVGSLLNFIGFALPLWAQPAGDQAVWINRIVPVVCFGMLLDFAAGLFEVFPEHFVLEYLGAADGVRLRMMRLARVAAIALSVLTLLSYSAARRGTTDRNADGWGGFFLACGAIGMPVILAKDSDGKRDSRWLTNVGILLFTAGSAVTIGVLVIQIFAPSSTYILSLGPAMVVIGAAICLC